MSSFNAVFIKDRKSISEKLRKELEAEFNCTYSRPVMLNAKFNCLNDDTPLQINPSTTSKQNFSFTTSVTAL